MTALHLPDADPAHLRRGRIRKPTWQPSWRHSTPTTWPASQANRSTPWKPPGAGWPRLDRPRRHQASPSRSISRGLAVGNVMATAIDKRHDTAWVSYWVSPHARGRGLASAATAGLAEHCFNELGLYRLELAHRVNNPGSGRVAVKAGFIPEGIERAKLRYLDEYGRPVRFDVQTYARLREDPSPALTPLRIGTYGRRRKGSPGTSLMFQALLNLGCSCHLRGVGARRVLRA